jgi:hypothetical protein
VEPVGRVGHHLARNLGLNRRSKEITANELVIDDTAELERLRAVASDRTYPPPGAALVVPVVTAL